MQKINGKMIIGLYLTAALPILTMPGYAWAKPVPTEHVLDYEIASGVRGKIQSALARKDVLHALTHYGVSVKEAEARIAALSDDEAKELSALIDDMPAGGDSLTTLIVALLFVFVLLLITDIVGMTKVYPFTRSVR